MEISHDLVTASRLDQIKSAHDEYRWLEAGRLLEEFRKTFHNNTPLPPSSNSNVSNRILSTDVDDNHNNWKKLLDRIEKDTADSRAVDEALAPEAHEERRNGGTTSTAEGRSAGTWKLSKDAKGIRVDYREEQQGMTCIKSVAVLLEMQAGVLSIVPLMVEADLVPTWMPRFMGMEVQILDRRAAFEMLLYMKIHIPFPFKNRYMVVHATAVDIVDERGGFLVLVQSEDPGERDLPLSSKDAIKADVHLAGALCCPTSPESVMFSNVVNMDMKMAHVPIWLINYLTRKVVWYAFAAFRKKAEEIQKNGLPLQHAKRFQEGKWGLYKDVARRFARNGNSITMPKVANLDLG